VHDSWFYWGYIHPRSIWSSRSDNHARIYRIYSCIV